MYRLGDRVRIHQEFTIPELRRAKQLADAGMACGAIAIALRVDFQTERTGDTIRKALKRYFPGWRACSPSANNGRPQNFERAGK